MTRTTIIKLYLFIGVLLISSNSCNRQYTPKPHGFPRIEFPEQNYEIFNGNCPFSFEKPTYALMTLDTNQFAESCWYNLIMPVFDATLHCSYKYFNKRAQVDSMMEDCYRLTTNHQIVAEGIEEREIHDSSGLQGMFYELYGNTATPFNFFVTDGENHFFRGSFYFNSHTNRDSVAPVIDFVKEDIFRMIKTFRFKD